MTPRERVLCALHHEEADRVPRDLGGSVVTSIALSSYRALRSQLGLPDLVPRVMETVQQIALVDDDVLEVLELDVVPLFANPATLPTVIRDEADGGQAFEDDFGATLRKPPGCHYFDWCEFPLREASLPALSRLWWPDPDDPARWVGLRERALALRAATDRAIFGMAPCGHDLFNQWFRVRGMAAALEDLLLNEEVAEAFFDRLLETILRAQTHFLDAVGDVIDIHFTADDICGQTAPLISPALYRRLIKPRQARIIALIKAKTQAKVFYHSCGAIAELIPDLIEMGVDILNPVQVSAKGMNTAALKREYGADLSLWGGGCDTQRVLPFASPEEVRTEVRQRLRELAPGGGFVFNPVHNIQPGVPAENILAMFSAVGAHDYRERG